MSWLTAVQHNDFMLTAPIPMEDALNNSELVVAKLIIQSGGAVARKTLITEFVETGIFSAPNLQIVLVSSPIIKILGFGVYGLRGVDVSDQALFDAYANVGNTIAPPSKADSEGWHSFKMELKEYNMRTGVIDFPSSIAKVISAGVYQAEGLINGSFSFGTTPSAPCRVTGFITLLRKAGVCSLDQLEIKINSQSMRVKILDLESPKSKPEDKSL
ncbi:hypothetical protein [Saezia sanguinis]|uniref:hypothetical protein n=1 Tax=Saezia sanguinis TaxID=1965230 RepID=UPI0030DA28A1